MLRDLCVDVLLERDFQESHKQVIFNMRGDRGGAVVDSFNIRIGIKVRTD